MSKKSIKRRRQRQRRKAVNPVVWFIGGGVLLIAAALFMAFGGGGDSGGGTPALAVDKQTIDYGDVKLGATITTSYTVRNVGDKPLVMKRRRKRESEDECSSILQRVCRGGGNEAAGAKTARPRK